MMFFNQEKKWKDWANRGKRKGEGRWKGRVGWRGRGRKKTKVGKKEGVKEKGKGYWINEIWQHEWNKISIKVNNQVCQMDEKMFMNAINQKNIIIHIHRWMKCDHIK
jgi:hypothetical protein